jgi:serine/threonine protein kinase
MKEENIHYKDTRVGTLIQPKKYIMPRLEGYVIRKEIAQGGMAVVYEAEEKSLNRVVALKVLSEELSRDDEVIRRFVNEAQAAARLNHPNIVQIYSIGHENNIYYFAMEYIRGESVEKMLEDGKRVPVKECIDIVRQTILALSEAYKNNIIHRDIKPGNLLVNENGVVKVADFGLAAEVRGAIHEKGGKVIGTPLYMSPEQARGDEVDFRSDIYSLGVTLYHMLSGKPPFMSSETKILIKSHIEKELPPLPASVLLPLRKLIRRMTEKNPSNRFSSYDLLMKEMENVNKTIHSRRYFLPAIVLGLTVVMAIGIYNNYYRKYQKQNLAIIHTVVDKNKHVEEAYKKVERYAKENPADHKYLIDQYFRVIKEYPNTEWAIRAEERIDKIMQAAVAGAQEELEKVKTVRERFIVNKQYKEIIDKYLLIKERYKDTEAETVAQSNIDYITEIARKDFQIREEKFKLYISHHKYKNARDLYSEVINKYGLPDFIKAAENRILYIDEVEKNYNIENEAKKLFDGLLLSSNKLLSLYKFNEAYELIKAAESINKNPIFKELVKKELERVEKLQIEYESKLIREKIALQLAIYNEITKKVNTLIPEYMYKEALAITEEGINKIDILEWKRKLQALAEDIDFLYLFKKNLIDSANKQLEERKIANITADDETLVFLVADGGVGVPWKDLAPEKIYGMSLQYLGKTAEDHVQKGVFCLSHNLYDEARREFTTAMRKNPNLEYMLEKYFAKLAEYDKE